MEAAIGSELGIAPVAVRAALRLIDEGATIPFVARYRKEATQGLDEVALRAIAEAKERLEQLQDRRAYVLKTIEGQGNLTPELREKILRCSKLAELEDLYLPFKPKRRTKAQIAREAGLLPLAERVLAQPNQGNLRSEALAYVQPDRGVADLDAVMDGVREIVAEHIAERADVRGFLRGNYLEHGVLHSRAKSKKREERTKFEDYYDYEERVAKIPSHRYLAIRRGHEEGVLRVGIAIDPERVLPRLHGLMRANPRSPFYEVLRDAIEYALAQRLGPSLENEIEGELKDRADTAAIDVFAKNLENLLLAAPFGPRRVVGIDPGLRTGCKCAALDDTGKFLAHTTIYPTRGKRDEEEAARELARFVGQYSPTAIAVGNGTGGRETEKFVRNVLKAQRASIPVVLVSEAGASVYSASDIARDEFPDLDLTIRGAISIGRRLQDPLAELVKIDPKSIGVGQYQHDVNQSRLQRKLSEVVESAVNGVGVDVNTASVSLLAYVAGIGPALAKNLVVYRNEHGRFQSRTELKKAKGLGARAFEQCAGFLRIRGGKNPLDASAVHPERYAVVKKMAGDLGTSLEKLIGNAEAIKRIDAGRYAEDGLGELTLRDILNELKKPGRDPRAEFAPVAFRDDLSAISDLKPGMVLEGVITNVAAFGAFVDVGVHQDGLVHISHLADRFVRDPNEVARVGDRVRVTVLEVDLKRSRISLSMKGSSGALPKK